MSFKLVSFLHL